MDRKKILIVDDDTNILEAMELVVESAGYQTMAIADANQVMKTIDIFKPDLLLLDVLLSGADGRDITKNIRNNQHKKRLPIILVSAHPGAKDSMEECGADAFLAKPFEIDDLLRLIDSHIKN